MQIAKVVGLLHHCIKVKGIVFLLLAPAQRELDGWDSSLETLYNERRPRHEVTKDVAANGTGMLTHVAAVAATNRRGSSRRRGHRHSLLLELRSIVCFFLLFDGARARATIGSDGVDFNQPFLGSWVPFRLLRPR